MKIFVKLFYIAVLLGFSFFSNVAISAQKVGTITGGTIYEIESKVMKEKRRFSVHLPRSYNENDSQKYPVLYVLDGNATRMRGVSGMVDSLSDFDLSQQIPEFIVVSIPNTDRSRDLTPTKGDLEFKGKVLDKLSDNSGGADIFAQFIRDELFSYIDSTFRTSSHRGILGMSFGGLFAAHIFLNQNEMFTHYLISDATFVWDDNYLNRTLKNRSTSLSGKNINIFIGLANNDHLGELGITNRKWGNDFVSALKSIDSDTLTVSSKYFPEERHGTVMFLAFYYGLIELFNENRNE